MILVTGIAGYIGSHTAVSLLQGGREAVGMDNFCNSGPGALDAIKRLTGVDFPFYEADLRDKESMRRIFAEQDIDAVVHFAGLKAVGESVEKPLLYYENNVCGTANLLSLMREYGVKRIVFSSSATVYGEPESVPISESAPTGAANPYGRTKLFIEEVLRDICAADGEFSAALLRYFNPIGAHGSGLIGENPNGIPNNLMPRICRTAKGLMKELTVFGDDYPTRDGTGVRDYIHVCDLAEGHLAALDRIERQAGVFVCNLGTGRGSSVYELIRTFSEVNGVAVPYRVCPRRAGDVPELYANPEKARLELGWKASRTLEDMCRSSWNYIRGK